VILTISLVLIFLVISAAVFRRFNIPMIILALAVGIFFGSDVTGIIYFDDAQLTKRIADIALVFVLFAGGYSIRAADLMPVLAPTMTLATLGVLLTTVVAALGFHLFAGWSLLQSLLVTVLISSTDAAAVFSILRNRTIRRRPSSITEIESAANDPMAIISTTFVVGMAAGGDLGTGAAILSLLWQLAGGVGIGLAVGWLGVRLLRRIRELESGYYYLLIIGLVLASYGFADLARASGVLSAFFAGFILGNARLPLKSALSSFTATFSFVGNAGLFLLLGLLMFPKSLGAVWKEGLILFLILTFLARPAVVFLCTWPARLPWNEKIFLAWSGIRGAVPIVLATYPAAAGLDPEHKIFNIIFLAVTLSILVQGPTIGRLAALLGLVTRETPRAEQKMELVTVHDTPFVLVELFLDPEICRTEATLASLDLPHEVAVTMITRKDRILAPRGSTRIQPGDILTILLEESKKDEMTKRILSHFDGSAATMT
jgi:cell volume regulation protein A